MAVKKGRLSIDSDNIFPIIKKWVYSDHDIFVRELISNACDAITKLRKLDMMGEYDLPDDYKAKIQVIVNPEEKTLKFIDNGLGMTAEEVEEYITQIAFSGATDFLEKYKDKTTEDEMIGHFGLGFYSAFMVADEVQIDSLSYRDGAAAIHWVSDGGTEYEMQEGNHNTVGTEITLHLNENSLEFANEYRVREVLEKYCSFMPVEIFLSKANEEPKYETINEEDVLESDIVEEYITETVPDTDAELDEIDADEATEETSKNKTKEVKKAKIVKRPESISDTKPLWGKNPSEVTKEEYIEFYRKVFMDYKEPLFWIHLNMDYPFNLKGILYFPKLNTEYDSLEGVIKLYNNQVFIADNIKEVIPDFLMVLKGVIDCPDLPLNVSRSALQNDGFVSKVADYISKKVADKINGMFKTDREVYEKYWDDISPFLKFGSLKDEKFGEKIKDAMLFKNLEGAYWTLQDCIDHAVLEQEALEATEEAEVTGETEADITVEDTTEELQADDVDSSTEDTGEEDGNEEKTKIFYVTDAQQQSQYIKMFKEQGQEAILLTHNIDNAYVTYLERHNETISFQRIDADVHDSLKDEVQAEEKETFEKNAQTLVKTFQKALSNDKLEVKVEKLKDANVASMAVLSEESRRMEEMMKMYSMGGMGMDPSMFGGKATLILNANHPLVQYVLENKKGDSTSLICKQLYDLAMLAHKPLSPDEMTAFVQRSNEIMLLLTK